MAAFGLVSPALIHELLAPPPQLGFFNDEPCYSYLSPTVACRTAAAYRPPALARRVVPAAPRPQPSLRVEQVAGGVLLTTVLPGYEEEDIRWVGGRLGVQRRLGLQQRGGSAAPPPPTAHSLPDMRCRCWGHAPLW